MLSLEINKKRILRTTIFTLFIALGSLAGFFMLIFEGIPFWKQTIAPAFNFVVNDLLGDVIRNSGIIGGVAGGYLAAKLCLRIVNNKQRT